MKRIAKITPIEGGYVYHSIAETGEEKVAFASSLIAAINEAMNFQLGHVDATPQSVVTMSSVGVRRGANGWAIVADGMFESRVADVLPLTATVEQLANAVEVAMAAPKPDDPDEATVAAQRPVLVAN